MPRSIQKEERQKSKLRIVIRISLGILAIGFCVILGILMYQFVSETERMEALMSRRPYVGRLVYVLMAFLQVLVALIPGEPVEIAGGYVFGAVEGTVLYLLGATLGSLLVFGVVRKFGVKLLELFFDKDSIGNLRFLQHSRRRSILLSFIFVLPGTPKDLLCYFAGLTDIPFGVWFWVCSVGRLPSIVTSMLGGDALETKSYMDAIVVFVVTLLVSVVGMLVYKGICRRHERKQEKHSL